MALASSASCVLAFVGLVCFFHSVSSWIKLDSKTLSNLNKLSFRVRDPHFILISHSVEIPCISENISVETFTGLTNNNVTWIDSEGQPIIGDKRFLRNNSYSLFLSHVQPEDSRGIFCFINYRTKIEHYVITYDVPHVRLEYSFQYDTALCSEPLLREKQRYWENLIEHNEISLHHGLLYAVSRRTCYFTEKKAYSQAKFIISCEDRTKDFKVTCSTLDCYFTNTSKRLLNASFDSASRWREIEYEPSKYLDIIDEYDRVKEFTLTDDPMETSFVSECPNKFELINGLLCIPCLSGRYYNNITQNCSDCPLNSFQPFDMMSECYTCPKNTETNITGSYSIEQCTPIKSVGERFVKENSKTITILLILVALCFVLLWCFYDRKRKFEEEEKAKKKAKKPPKDKSLAEIDIPGKKEYYVSPKKKIIEISRADFLIKAQENRSKTKPQFVHTFHF